jgi:hypothetical protein
MSATAIAAAFRSGRSAGHETSTELWQSVDRLVARAPRLSDLRYHGLEHLAARRLRRLGQPVPAELSSGERAAAVVGLIAPLVLERILDTYDGRVALMKGPELALRYPDEASRPYRDLDILVDDADKAWHALREAGFTPAGDPALYIDGLHHLRPLVLPELPLIVEIHHRPKWIEGMPTPSTDELLATAVPSVLGVRGLLALEPARHAIVLAAHAWAHVPLSRLGRLIDVAAMSRDLERDEVEAIARDWGVDRVWRTTSRVLDALLADRPRPLAGHVWARHLWAVRERTVLERHLQRWLSPYAALPVHGAVAANGRHLADELRPEPGETRREQVGRVLRAFRNAFTRLTDHNAKGGQT